MLQATAGLLAQVGYDALTYEAVATQAGVHKTTIYRRWPTKADLVADAARERSEQFIEVPNTGTLLGDLRGIARAVATNLGSDVGAAMTRTLVAAALTSPPAAAASQKFWAERLGAMGAIVERAIERGDLPPCTDANLVIESLVGALYSRVLLTGEPIDIGLADQLAIVVASGWTTGS